MVVLAQCLNWLPARLEGHHLNTPLDHSHWREMATCEWMDRVEPCTTGLVDNLTWEVASQVKEASHT